MKRGNCPTQNLSQHPFSGGRYIISSTQPKLQCTLQNFPIQTCASIKFDFPPHKKRKCSWSRLFFRIPSGPNHHISEWLAFGVPGIYDSNMFQQTKKKASNRYAQTFFAKKNLMVCKFLYKDSSLRKHSKTLAQIGFFRTHIASTWPIPFATSHAPTFRRRRGGPRWRKRCKWHGIHWPLGWPGGLGTKQVGSHPRCWQKQGALPETNVFAPEHGSFGIWSFRLKGLLLVYFEGAFFQGGYIFGQPPGAPGWQSQMKV